MVTKGLVIEIVDTYYAKVRLPVYDRVPQASMYVRNDDLQTATICTIPNCRPNLRVGDIVFVEFEDSDFTKPVIIGCLYGDGISKSYADAEFNSLRVFVNTVLSEDTTIGKTRPKDIENLSGTVGNLQQQIDLLSARISALEES